MRLASAAALLVAIVLFLTKAAAWFATGSVALLGSVLDSGLDILATAFNFVAVRHALQPADHEHRFGHGKAEALAGLIQGAFIGGSAAFLIVQTGPRILSPEPLEASLAGIAVTVFAIFATLALVTFQAFVIARTRSLAIRADELHYRSDLLLNGAVLVALFLSGPAVGWLWVDPVMGLLIALYIGWSAFRIARMAYDQLMDREFDDVDRERIAALVSASPGVRSFHDLRTRRAGRDAFIQFHLELDPDLRLKEAHAISEDVEARVRAAYPEAEVIIHQDPAETEEGHSQVALSDRAILAH